MTIIILIDQKALNYHVQNGHTDLPGNDYIELLPFPKGTQRLRVYYNVQKHIYKSLSILIFVLKNLNECIHPCITFLFLIQSI